MPLNSCTDLGPYNVDECPAYKLSDVGGIAILLNGFDGTGLVEDFSTDGQTEWQAASTANKLYMLPRIKATLSEPSPAEVEAPFVGGSQETIGYENVITWQDGTVDSTNDSFYENLNNTVAAGIVMYFTEESEMRVYLGNVSFQCPMPIGSGARTIQVYNVTAKFFTKRDSMPTLYTAPANVWGIGDIT